MNTNTKHHKECIHQGILTWPDPCPICDRVIMMPGQPSMGGHT